MCRTYRPVTKRSFPHVRGYSRRFVELHVVERFPPAYAGVHSHLTYPYRLHQPPSRTCGDAADFHVHRESRALPLPRMRGCTTDQWRLVRRARVLPARAGMHPTGLPGLAGMRLPSHECGDLPIYIVEILALPAFFPQMRGCSRARTTALRQSCMLPAYAGMIPAQELHSEHYDTQPAHAGMMRHDDRPYGGSCRPPRISGNASLANRTVSTCSDRSRMSEDDPHWNLRSFANIIHRQDPADAGMSWFALRPSDRSDHPPANAGILPRPAGDIRDNIGSSRGCGDVPRKAA